MRKILLITLCCLCAAQAIAQSYFNVRSPLHSFASGFTSVVPLNGNYYGIGFCLDSTNLIPGTTTAYPVWGIKFAKFGPDGNKLIDTFFQKPGVKPDITVWNAKAILISENAILTAARNIDTNHICHLALYCFDTTGYMIWEKEFERPDYSDIDTAFWSIEDFRATSDGNWLMLSSIWSPTKKGDMVVTKLDQNFEVIWHKRYGDNMYETPGRVIETADGNYMVAGCRDNIFGPVNHKIVSQVQFYKTDTAGNLLGQWRSDTSHLHSFVRDLIQTSDGGYLYVGRGEGWQDPDYLITYFYNGWIEKLDSEFNTQWARVIGFGDNSMPYRVYEKENGDIHVFGQMLDTPISETKFQRDGYWFTLNGATGNTLRSRKYYGIRSEYDWNVFYDARPTPDGGYVMVGFSNDQSSTVVLPNQRGWIVKVDSTGCLGPDDPQCQPTAIAQPGLELMQLAIYPNPVQDQLSVNLPKGLAAMLEIVDMQGRVALRQDLNGGMQQVNVQNLPSGNYLYRISENGKLLAKGKLVKN